MEPDTSQMLRIPFGRVKAVQGDCLIAHHAIASVAWCRVNTAEIHPAFSARDEECTRLMYQIQSSEIQVSPVHNVEGPGLNGQDIEHVDITHLAVADVNERGNVSTQI